TLIGLNWGIFASLVAVGVLFAAGLDLRRHGPRNAVPGPPLTDSDEYPDVDPATIVVRAQADEPTTVVRPRAAEPPTVARPPSPPATGRPVPAPPADDQT